MHGKSPQNRPIKKIAITINVPTGQAAVSDIAPEDTAPAGPVVDDTLPPVGPRAILPEDSLYAQRLAKSGSVPPQKHLAFLMTAIAKHNRAILQGVISTMATQRAAEYIQQHIDEAFPGHGLQLRIYGGAANEISTSGGDIDSTLFIRNLSQTEAFACKQFHSVLQQHSNVTRMDGTGGYNNNTQACLDRIFTERFSMLDFSITGYYRAVIPPPELEKEYRQLTSLRNYSTLPEAKQKDYVIDVMDLFQEAASSSKELEHFILRRTRWQNIMILGWLATKFDTFEINSFITRTRIPILKLRLKYSKSDQRIISAQETNQKVSQGTLPSYYADLPMNRAVRFITEEGEEEVNTHVNSDLVQLNVDICLNNYLAVCNTELLSEYLKGSPVARTLVLFVKTWASVRNLCNTRQGGLSSYGFVLLVIFYLQTLQSPVLPVLQPGRNSGPIFKGCYTGFVSLEDAWRRRGLMLGSSQQEPRARAPTLAELLCGFFRYYGYQFNMKTSVVSIRLGRVLSKQEKNWTEYDMLYNAAESPENIEPVTAVSDTDLLQLLIHPQPTPPIDEHQQIQTRDFQYFYFCIEDPFETHINVGRLLNSKTAGLLAREFRRGYSLLRKNEQPMSRLLLPSTIDPPGGSNLSTKELLKRASTSASQPTCVTLTMVRNKILEFADSALTQTPLIDD